MEIATNKEALRQVSQVVLSREFGAEAYRFCAVLCQTLAYNPETHSYLAAANMTEALCDRHIKPFEGEGYPALFQ